MFSGSDFSFEVSSFRGPRGQKIAAMPYELVSQAAAAVRASKPGLDTLRGALTSSLSDSKGGTKRFWDSEGHIRNFLY